LPTAAAAIFLAFCFSAHSRLNCLPLSAAAAKGAAEREKREKEEAAKKARAAAAERGRQLSREWAEKQKAKKMAAAAVGKSEGAEVVDVAATATV